MGVSASRPEAPAQTAANSAAAVQKDGDAAQDLARTPIPRHRDEALFMASAHSCVLAP